MSDELSMTPDMDLAKKLRNNFTARACSQAVLDSVTELCATVGVTVKCEIVEVDKDFNVQTQRSEMAAALGRLASAQGALLAGGNLNIIAALNAQEPLQIPRERQKD